MDRKSSWLIAATILAGFLILGFSQAIAQREFRTDPRAADSRQPRYQVVNVTEGEIIIMDVTSGDLYSAKPRDVKPYDARPRVEEKRPAFEREKDEKGKVDEKPRFFEDKIKDDGRFKDKAKDKE
jgi:hypothetical protein